MQRNSLSSVFTTTSLLRSTTTYTARLPCLPAARPLALASLSSRRLTTTVPRRCTRSTPSEEIMQASQLLERNAKWSSETQSARPALLAELAKAQKPKILWIGCADSRVPESVICNVDPGDIFVTRNIANQFRPDDDNAKSVLEFAVQSVGVEHVVVVGHSGCGGIMASVTGVFKQIDPATSPLIRQIAPLYEITERLRAAHPSLSDSELIDLVTRESVKQQVRNVVASPTVQDNWSGKTSPLSGQVMTKVQVHGWVFDIAKGQLIDLNVSQSASS